MADRSEFEIAIPSDTSLGYEVQERILAMLETSGYTDRDVFGVKLSLEEALVNAIKHGNGMDPEKLVKVQCRVDDVEVLITIEDEGEGFNPEDVPDPTDDDNLEKPSGRGLMLMRAFMTGIHYNERGNRVELHKLRTVETPDAE